MVQSLMNKLLPIVSLISGVTLTKLNQFSNEHGALLHMLRCDAAEFTRFGECYFAEMLPGAIKTWKRHRIQTQNLAVPVGRIRMVIYDDRDESVTRRQLQELEVGRPDAYLLVQIPPGLWYGFACIGDTPALLVNCTDFPHDPTESEQSPPNSLIIPYQWTS